MPNTHCLPSGSLGTAELPVMPINVRTTTETKTSGPYRGVVVIIHGLNQTTTTVPPPALSDGGGFGVTSRWLTLAGTLNTDGWVVLQVSTSGDNYHGDCGFGIASDINNDTGTRYRLNISHWWAHVCAYVATTYGATWPIVPIGASWGGLHALAIAQDYTPAPVAIMAVCPATIVSNLSSNLWHGTSISNSSGVNISTTALNSYSGPSLIAYGTSDGIVGYSASSSPVSNIDAMITNAVNAGRSCTRMATDYTGHGFDTVDAATIQTWFTNSVDPLCPKSF